ncbi:hypothetical protein F5Y12DRAFT_742659 [Xylaria sp. FL1777]|nr:hypothetical protein F5Y12DRAFT_742659 [Xylaria sp. FL1777]
MYKFKVTPFPSSLSEPHCHYQVLSVLLQALKPSNPLNLSTQTPILVKMIKQTVKINKIIKASDMDILIKQGQESQRVRGAAIQRHTVEEATRKRRREMRKMSEDAGRASQLRRGKGI